MNADLRESLHRLADTAPPADPAGLAPDAWTAGRRRRRRDRVVTASLVLVLVFSLGGLATTITDGGNRAAPANDATADQVGGPPAVPSVVEPPDDVGTPDTLAVGRASVAYVLDDDRPVVVGSLDGHHRALDLEGWRPGSPLALSPDGNRLLWVQVDDDTTSQQLAVGDLHTGQVTELDTPSDADEAINHVSWAPGSRRVAWVAQESDGSAVRSVSLRRTVDGVRWLLPERASTVAVSDRGDLAVGIEGAIVHLDRRTDSTRTVQAPGPVRPGAFSPSGKHVALESDGAPATYTLDTGRGEVVGHPFPGDTFATAGSRPLGWMDDRLQVLLVRPGPDEAAELVITTPEVDETSTWRRRVGTVAPEVVSTVSIAVDLLPALDGTTHQPLTRDFDAAPVDGLGGPVAPADAFALLTVALAVLAVLLLVVLLGRVVVRRRRV